MLTNLRARIRKRIPTERPPPRNARFPDVVGQSLGTIRHPGLQGFKPTSVSRRGFIESVISIITTSLSEPYVLLTIGAVALAIASDITDFDGGPLAPYFPKDSKSPFVQWARRNAPKLLGALVFIPVIVDAPDRGNERLVVTTSALAWVLMAKIKAIWAYGVEALLLHLFIHFTRRPYRLAVIFISFLWIFAGHELLSAVHPLQPTAKATADSYGQQAQHPPPNVDCAYAGDFQRYLTRQEFNNAKLDKRLFINVQLFSSKREELARYGAHHVAFNSCLNFLISLGRTNALDGLLTYSPTNLCQVCRLAHRHSFGDESLKYGSDYDYIYYFGNGITARRPDPEDNAVPQKPAVHTTSATAPGIDISTSPPIPKK